ncbi:HDOD domain-containing protein [Thauera sp.]|uniref:HDOD domain-containing protein n=1 Tax=Thauera sp. TaxID=1905334 RepID=UPI0039E5FB4D
MHSAQELASQVESLTSLPTVYERIREQLESPTGSVFEVARLVSADPALTARLLRLVEQRDVRLPRRDRQRDACRADPRPAAGA